MTGVSVAIIAGNEEQNISDCLKSALFSDEIIVVLANSSDRTKSIIQSQYPQVKIVETSDEYNKNFSKWRNLAYQSVKKNQWLFYLDADERITPLLQTEIKSISTSPNSSPKKTYYVVPRANHFLKHRVRHGGTYPDYVKRLYYMPKFKGYSGNLHEEPIIEGELGYLVNDLLHFTHNDLTSMLSKSIVWTSTESELLFNNHHPPVLWWRFFRMMLTKFNERFIKQKFWLDGEVGFISTIFEMFNTYMIYAKLYEKQKN